MRTTITLTPEADSLVRKVMHERSLSFKDAVNAAIVHGLMPRTAQVPFTTPTFDLGHSRGPIEHALCLAGELEDEELLRKQLNIKLLGTLLLMTRPRIGQRRR